MVHVYAGPRDNISSLFMTWLSEHLITNKLIGCALTAFGCVALLMGYKPAGITDEMVWGDPDGRMLRELAASEEPVDDYFPIWIFMSSGILLEMNFFFTALTNPDQELGILFITINKMMGQDIAKFMKVFTIVFINYGFAMYICYPRVGDVFAPLNSPEFNSLTAAVQALVELALLGETPALVLGNFGSFSTGQLIEFWVYVTFLMLYLIMALILLLNLLIAMMGDTFTTVQEQAVREARRERADAAAPKMLARVCGQFWRPDGRCLVRDDSHCRRYRRGRRQRCTYRDCFSGHEQGGLAHPAALPREAQEVNGSWEAQVMVTLRLRRGPLCTSKWVQDFSHRCYLPR